MTTKPSTRQKSMPKPPAAVETRESLEAQVAAFLNSGGEIQQIAKGVTGQNYGAPSRHISLGKK
ncbi:hypothetical protein SAMN05216272_10494 [Pseudomonas panipatensis]|uniref:Transcriptional regulator SutA RNAP-binding domain-containing protein n=2 Tax=Pseudomonas panipatensis TaxID=428992 RepID=A0A1G8G9A3_9PSED|nr:hypothetical protein [Pseudomonas panipatensis]SDH90975.1 hypothetical protein SAMN05216272_10494 [Pseudomonas panipatensis]SMP44747.1 hypothetical protein SAMN06295951_101890 [Pseudomonas panipatensis]